MSGEDIKVAIQRLHVHRVVHDRLRAIHQYFRAVLMRQRDHLTQRVFRAQHVRYVVNRQQLRAIVKQRRQRFQLQRPVGIQWDNAQFCTCAGAQHLPGDNIGVVFHFTDDDVITRPNIAIAPAVRHQVDALRRTANKHQLFG